MEELRAIGTESAIQSADALTENLSSGKVKGFFRDLLKKIAPGLPQIPGITQDEPIRPDTEDTPDDPLSDEEHEAAETFKRAPGSGDSETE